ncbi:hypothetical protein EB118_19380, partial [bacterium]|nr:hypothetical protein [bacterium]
MIHYSKKSLAQRHKGDTQIICNENITKYFLMDSYIDFKKLIEDTESPCYYEFIHESTPVKFFMDIEIYSTKHKLLFDMHTQVILSILRSIKTAWAGYDPQAIVLQSHNENKKSYHIILNGSFAFACVKGLKPIVQQMFPDLVQQKVIDTSVYREGLFRTYLSSKSGEGRPLVASELSDPFDFTDTFVCCFNEAPEIITTVHNDQFEQQPQQQQQIQYELTQVDKRHLEHFLRLYYAVRPSDIRDYVLEVSTNCIVVPLHDKFCYNVKREHRSNHQYIVIDTYSAKQKCHDTDCANYKHNEVKYDKYPTDLATLIKRCLRASAQEQDLVE